MGWSLHRKPGLTTHNPALSFKGYTLITVGDGIIYLVDMAGRVVHDWQVPGWKAQYAYFTEAGTILTRGGPPRDPTLPFRQAEESDELMPIEERCKMLPSNYQQLRELSWDSEVLWEHEDPLLHHDFFQTKRDTVLVMRNVLVSHELSQKVRGWKRAKKNDHPLVADEYQEINRAGEVLWSVRLDELLDPVKDPIAVLERRIEWTHSNAICENPEGTKVLFSCKNISRVGIIDKATNTLDWRLGEPTISGQHHARFLPNGNVHLFDNGTRKPGLPASRVAEIDPATDKVVWEYQANPPFSFFSPHISSADRLPNGNTFICEGASGRLFEVTRRGETVWEWHNPFTENVRNGQVNTALWRAHRYSPQHPALAGRELNPDRYRALNEMYGLA
jgi:hypothetical protein